MSVPGSPRLTRAVGWLSLSLLALHAASAGSIASRADLVATYSSYDIDTFEGATNTASTVTFPSLAATTVVAGAGGPGLVSADVTYTGSPNLTLLYNGDFGLSTHTLQGAGENPVTLTFSTPMAFIGFDMQAFSGYPQTGTVTVYGPGSVILDSENVNGPFFGWADSGGITQVVIADVGANSFINLDNVTYGPVSAVPEPAPVILIAAVLGLTSASRLLGRRRRLGP